MSNLPGEIIKPDATGSPLNTDQTAQRDNYGDASATAETDAVEVVSETKDTNGAAEATKNEESKAENGDNEHTNAEPEIKTYENGMLKTTAKEEKYRSNSRYDPSVLPSTDDPKKIRAQVEFYFGDANLPTDKFMWDMTDGSTNLPISIEKICSFGRMKRFRPVSAVVNALRSSSFLEVTGAEGQEVVKRKVAYDPTVPRSKAESRSVYVKGFGDEEPSSQFDIEAFFAPYGPTNAVRLRRTGEKLFKGSVFVEFQDDETAEKFLALDPKPLWKGKHVLKIQSKKEYTDLKEQEIKDGKTEPGETWGSSRGHGGKGRGRGGNRSGRGDRERGGHDRGDRDPDDWKKRREEDRASGFKPRRGGGDRRGNRDRDSRGGRGRRDERGPRTNDRNRERAEENGDKKPEGDSKAAIIGSDVAKVENEKKRLREEDGTVDETPAKKIDMKPEVAAETS